MRRAELGGRRADLGSQGKSSAVERGETAPRKSERTRGIFKTARGSARLQGRTK